MSKTPEQIAEDITYTSSTTSATGRLNLKEAIHAAIRAAVAAERERCAKVAEEYAGVTDELNSYDRGWWRSANLIAHAIRNPQQEEQTNG